METAEPFLFFRKFFTQGQYGYTTLMVKTPDEVGVSTVMSGLTRERASAAAAAIADELHRFVRENDLDTRAGLAFAKKNREYRFASYSVEKVGPRSWMVMRNRGERNVVAFGRHAEATKFIDVMATQLFRFRQDNGLLLPGESSSLTDAEKAAVAAARKAAQKVGGRAPPKAAKANGSGRGAFYVRSVSGGYGLYDASGVYLGTSGAKGRAKDLRSCADDAVRSRIRGDASRRGITRK